MRASAPDFTVEVRDRDFHRLGQVAPEYTDIKFTDVFNGVGAWEMKLPAEHRLLPHLKAKGSGIVVTEHWVEYGKQPPVYGAWNEVDRNLYTDPLAVDAGALPSSSGGTGALVADFPDTEVTTAYRWERTTSSAARMIDLKLGANTPVAPGWWLSFDVEANQPLTIELALRPAVGASSPTAVVTNLSVPAGVSRQAVQVGVALPGDPTSTAGITFIARGTTDFPIGGVVRVTKVKMGASSAWFNPTAADTDVRRQGFEGAANASQSVQEERTRTEQPEGETHKYRVYSGRMRSARLSQDAADPAGTWLFTGVHDNVVAAATSVWPDPAHEAGEQAASHWELSGAGETVMKEAVRLNAGSGAIAGRAYPWLTVKPNLLRGLPVKTSSRFDGLGDLLTSLGSAAGLGWRFAQSGDVVEFDVYEPADKTKLVRLDIRNGGVQSNELGYTAPSATDVLVMGQGQGEERTILKVTTPEAQQEAEDWGIRWEQTKDQRQTDDPVELEQAGLEVVAEQGVTVNSLKVVPSDHPRMRLGVDWYIGDRVTAVVEGQETQALVTQVATSISAAGVIRQASVGDPVGFSFDAKIASKVKDVEKRVGAVERLVGQGTAWGDVGGKPTEFPSAWALIGGGDHGRGTTAQRDAQFGVPGTTAQRVALANRRVTWFNTDLGWEESYYTVAGASGLTAPGLLSGVPSGWYPVRGVGNGPSLNLQGAAVGMTNGQYYSNYYEFGTQDSWRSHGNTYFQRPAANPDRVYFYMPGRYRVRARVGFPAGSGTGVCSLVTWTAPGAQADIYQIPVPLLSSYGQQHIFEVEDRAYTTATSFANWRTDAAAWTVTVEWLKVEYLGPALGSA